MKIKDFKKIGLIGKVVKLLKETYGEQESYFYISTVKIPDIGKNIIIYGNWLYVYEDGTYDMELDIKNEMYPNEEVELVDEDFIKDYFIKSAVRTNNMFLGVS